MIIIETYMQEQLHLHGQHTHTIYYILLFTIVIITITAIIIYTRRSEVC